MLRYYRVKMADRDFLKIVETIQVDGDYCVVSVGNDDYLDTGQEITGEEFVLIKGDAGLLGNEQTNYIDIEDRVSAIEDALLMIL